MRLTRIRIAGFKTFVDPTTVSVPGNLAGIVGPNGCGKSNIIDAVRWVLGETRASALRGASMQDVIFSGSTTRKPVSRASVELVFDNSEGRAAGQWKPYAEIAVRRVIERQGDARYYINNLAVRRKDVVDLFLGTGLGPRAYAIIEQGMISRIIEARPDEIRSFLEEAAGVTRYRERRRETEHRLRDAGDNLSRLADIRRELGERIEHLDAQAASARRYRALTDRLHRAQVMLWWQRAREADDRRTQAATDLNEATLALDRLSAALNHAAVELDEARGVLAQQTEHARQAQQAVYDCGAVLTRAEAARQQATDQLAAIGRRLGEMSDADGNWQQREASAREEQARWQALSDNARQRLADFEAQCALVEARGEPLREARRLAEATASVARHAASTTQQQLRAAEAASAASRRTLDAGAQRIERLERELAGLSLPDPAETAHLEQQTAQAKADVMAIDAQLDALRKDLPTLDDAVRRAQQALREAQRLHQQREAAIGALDKLQRDAQTRGDAAGWCRRHGLTAGAPLWRALRVAEGAGSAVEAALRERLSALPADHAVAAQLVRTPPAESLSLYLANDPHGADALAERVPPPLPSGARWLRTLVECDDPAIARLLDDALHGVALVSDLVHWLPAAASLPDGLMLLSPGGQRLDRHGIDHIAASVNTQGVLERERELDALRQAQTEQAPQLAAARAAVGEAEARQAEHKRSLDEQQRNRQQAQQHAHQQELALLTHMKAGESQRARAGHLERDLEEARRLFEAETAHLNEASRQMDALQARLTDERKQQDAAEGALTAQRDKLAAHNRDLAAMTQSRREAEFSVRECDGKRDAAAAALATAQSERERLAAGCDTLLAERNRIDLGMLDHALQAALGARADAEAVLAQARDALQAAEQRVRQADEQRLVIERDRAPVQERITALREALNRAAMESAQAGERLDELRAEGVPVDALLSDGLPAADRPDLDPARTAARLPDPAELGRQAAELQRAIKALGAVNLAAVSELEQATTRQQYLDEQADDLVRAIGTLEDAIRRIDRDTRHQLKQTFEQVSAHFSELFPQLFGGGRAVLELTGEEILDAGIEIIAQPPGKKNSSIHLLSGGEKALTAIALVFAMFQLNPAPFCMLDEVDAPLDDANTERYGRMVKRMSSQTQFIFITHSKITMEIASHLIGVTMQEQGVSRIVDVDIDAAMQMADSVVS